MTNNKKLIIGAKELKKIGISNVAIGKELRICADTIAKYLILDSFAIQENHSKLDDYILDIKGKGTILYHILKSIKDEVRKEIVNLKRNKKR